MNKKIILFTCLTLFILLMPLSQNSSPSYAGGGNEVGINLGAHWDANAIKLAHDITQDGGWVVLLITPGSADALTEALKAAKEYKMNVVLRLYNGGNAFLPTEATEQAKSWVATIGCAIENSGTNQKIYIEPWNEPFMDGEHNGIPSDRGQIAAAVIAWMDALKAALSQSTVGNQAALLSPMFNQFGAPTGGIIDNVNAILSLDNDFYSGLAGAAMNLYGQYNKKISEGGGLVGGDGIRNGQGYRNNVLCALQRPNGMGDCQTYPVFALESGIGLSENPGCSFVHYGDVQPEILNYYSTVYKQVNPRINRLWENDSNFKMFAIFSYQPATSCSDYDIDWIWGSDVASYFQQVRDGGQLDLGGTISGYGTWLSGQSLEKCADTNCGYVIPGQQDQCNPVNTGVGPLAVGVKMMCFITPSPSQSGSTITSFVDPDCPGRIVSPNISVYPMNPPGGHFCITFTKNADQTCIAADSGTVNYSFTVKVDCPPDSSGGTGKDLLGATVVDPGLGITYGPFSVPNNTSLTIPQPTETISATTTNTATLTGSYAGSTINLTSSATVRVEGPDGCKGCYISNVPYFCQRDSAWSNNYCSSTCPAGGPTNITIGQAGCGISSEAMIINYHRNTSHDPTPATICSRWGIYFNCGASASYLGSPLTLYYSETCPAGNPNAYKNSYFDEIRTRICANQPLAAFINYQGSNHIVVITGIDPVNQTVTTNDPYWGCGGSGQVPYDFDTFYHAACAQNLTLYGR